MVTFSIVLACIAIVAAIMAIVLTGNVSSDLAGHLFFFKEHRKEFTYLQTRVSQETVNRREITAHLKEELEALLKELGYIAEYKNCEPHFIIRKRTKADERAERYEREYQEALFRSSRNPG